MHRAGPIAKRTRSKEAEFFMQYHAEYKKKRTEEKSVSKASESKSSGGFMKGNSCGSSVKCSLREHSRFSGGGKGVDFGAYNSEDLDFLDTDCQYEKFLHGHIDSMRQGSINKRSGFSGCEGSRTNLMEEHVNSSGDDTDGGVGDDNDGMNICKTSENGTGDLKPETKECVIISDDDDDDGINICEVSGKDTGNLQPEIKECVSISDDDDVGGGGGDDNGGVNMCESSENDVGNLQPETNFLEECEEISDDDNDGGVDDDNDGVGICENGNLQWEFQEEIKRNWGGHNVHRVDVCDILDGSSEQLESSEMQPKFQAESERISDDDNVRRSSEENSEESESYSEDFSEKDSSGEDNDASSDEDYEQEKSESSFSAEELYSDHKEEEEEQIKFVKKNVSNRGKEDDAEAEMTRKNVSESSASAEELYSDDEEEEEERIEFVKKNDSNEGEKGDTEAEMTRKSVSESSASAKALCSDHEEEEEEQIEFVKKNVSERGKEDDAEAEMMKKNVFGRQNLLESKDSNENVKGKVKSNVSLVRDEINCVAKRTRSHSKSVGQPICVDEELGGSNDKNDDSETDGSGNDQTTKLKRGEDRSVKRKGDSANKEAGDKFVQDLCKERPTITNRANKAQNIVNILADSILENSEIPCEEKIDLDAKPTLSLKFTFGTENTSPVEKSEEEKELDELWAEMAIALCETFTDNTMRVDSAADEVPEVELDRAAFCDQGDHHFILDEEIGLICKYCYFVKVESRYLTAPFSKNPFGRSERRYFFTAEHHTSGDFHYHDFMDNSGSGHDPSFLKQGTVWDIIPGISKGMHQHQREGFEFLWRMIAGDIHLDKLKEANVGGERGCVISHAPGTGKTRLTIAFLQTYMKLYPLCKAVIIAPCSMLLTWEAEFQKWKVDLPFHNLNNSDLSGKENISAVRFSRESNSLRKVKLNRMVKLYSWAKDRSILGVSYRLFSKLVGQGKNKIKEDEAEKNRRILFEHTGLLVLDEGHTARNDNSDVWQALSKIQTEKRIILSGTPFQNNFDELFNTLWLVRPKFVDEIPFVRHNLSNRRRGKKSGARGVWASVTKQICGGKDDSVKAQRLRQLKEVIGSFVHIHKGSILQEKLPGLRDSLVILQPCQLQKDLLVNAEAMKELYFSKEHMISVLSVHPSLLLKIGFDWKHIGHNIDGLESRLREFKLNPEAGIKTKFLMEFIQLCEAVNERVLVFSQFIHPLKLIRKQLESQFKWSRGSDILYMSGNDDPDKRQQFIKDFNDPKSEAKVLLASTRACSEGINLVGASRVVLLDVVWNPSVERQAISRAYRLGQERIVHIYHLITSGTLEEEKYCRQAEKDRLSNLLFYSADKADNSEKTPSNLTDGGCDKILEHMVDHEKLKDMFKTIIYQPKDTNMIESFGFLES